MSVASMSIATRSTASVNLVAVTPAPDTRPPLEPAVLQGLPAPFRVELRNTVPSTNALVAELAARGATEGLVVVAEHQTAGRGRLDRTWDAPPRTALTFSVLLRPRAATTRWALLPLLTGLVVAEGIAEAGGPPASLKWPNDVLSHDGLKVAGVLLERVETPTGPAAVVGVGLNVSGTRTELPVETAGSLVTAGMVDPDRTLLLRRLLEQLARRYPAWAEGGADSDRDLLVAYAERCDTIGREVQVHLPTGQTLQGAATGLDEHGALVVQDEEGAHAVHAGDVVHVRVP
jgi:BirA family transcriptional regulator, biotin operon repressor / biotin---[acetyl-CoA-carboxylase] ligase